MELLSTTVAPGCVKSNTIAIHTQFTPSVMELLSLPGKTNFFEKR